MKYCLLLFVLFIFCCLNVHAEDSVSFTISDGIDSLELKAYYQKDINFLDQVFSEDALVITDKVITTKRHPVNPNFYGITLHQGWTSGSYHDDGYLFLLWDFTNEDAPQILDRTWQPDKIDGKPLPKDEVFSLSNFNI